MLSGFFAFYLYFCIKTCDGCCAFIDESCSKTVVVASLKISSKACASHYYIGIINFAINIEANQSTTFIHAIGVYPFAIFICKVVAIDIVRAVAKEQFVSCWNFCCISNIKVFLFACNCIRFIKSPFAFLECFCNGYSTFGNRSSIKRSCEEYMQLFVVGVYRTYYKFSKVDGLTFQSL